MTNIRARQPYARRPAPQNDLKPFLDTEFANIQRGIPVPVVRAVFADDTVQASDDTIEVDATAGAVTITLPPPDRLQFLRVTVIRVDDSANDVLVLGNMGGTTSIPLQSSGDLLTVQSDGTSWLVLTVLRDGPFNVTRFGAVGDDATDNTTAIGDAITALRAAPYLGELYFPPGTYRYASTLDFSDIPMVRGAGRSITTLKPTATLGFGADAITFSAAAVGQCVLQDFTLDGVLTSNTTITGIHLTTGENLTLFRVGVTGFDTTNSVGFALDSVIFPRSIDCFFGFNYINIDVGTNALASFPTMVRFDRCETRSAVASGLRIGQAFDMLWLAGKIEGNGQQGVIARPGVGQVVQDLTIDQAYMESNSSGVPTEYGAFFDNSAGGSIGHVSLVRCHINGGAGTEKAAYFNNVTGWLLDGVSRPGSAGAFKVEGASGYGWVEHWFASNGDIDSTIDDTATNQAQHDEQWVTFTPALAGGGTLVVSSVVTTTARFKHRGRTTLVNVNVAFTIATSNSPNVNLTMPNGLAIRSDMTVPCLVSEGGGALQAGTAHLIPSAPGTSITFNKLTGANWANGANNAIQAQLIVETT